MNRKFDDLVIVTKECVNNVDILHTYNNFNIIMDTICNFIEETSGTNELSEYIEDYNTIYKLCKTVMSELEAGWNCEKIISIIDEISVLYNNLLIN